METFLASDDDVVSQLSSLNVFDYIIVGSGIGGGILAEELLKKGNKNVLLIEKGDAIFSTHVCNTARPEFARGKEDSPEGNETIYNKLKSWVQTEEDSEPYVGGPLHCLGGRSVVWGLWIPRADEKTLDDHFPAAVASDLKTRWYQEAFNLVTNNSQKENIYPEGYIDVEQLNTSRAELTEAIKPFMLKDHPVKLGPVATQFHSPAPYQFPQGAYSTAVPLLNRIYARDRRLTVLLNSEVLNVDFTRTADKNAVVVSLTVRRVSTQKIFKIFVGKAKVILSAGTINTPCIALNSGIQFLDESKEALVGKGLIDHAIWGVRFAKQREPLASARSPINFQTMIQICGTTALLTVTINNNFFLAGSSSLPINQYLDKTGGELSPIANEIACSFEDNNVETIAVLLEFGAKLRDDNQVFSSGSPNPVIRMRRHEVYTDEESQIYMQILATSIRNTVITRILPTENQPESQMAPPWTDVPIGTPDLKGNPPIIPNPSPSKCAPPTSDSVKGLEGDEPKHPKIPIRQKLSETFAPRLSLLGAGIFAHEVGTMRMDAPPAPGESNVEGVVDTDLLVHGFDNLYVCDLSVFPYSPEANPALTLAALSLRLANHLDSKNPN